PFSLFADTTITLTPSSAFVVSCSVEPTGLQFGLNNPVTMSFDYRGTSADPLSPNYTGDPLFALWFNSSNSSWSNIGGFDDEANKRCNVMLGHFSYYALAK